jgi:hypothetical protein
MLYVRYVHLTKDQAYSWDKPIFSSEIVLHMDYGPMGSVGKGEETGRESQGACPQDDLIGGELPVVVTLTLTLVV